MQTRLRSHIEIPQLAQKSRRGLGRNRHRLLAMSARNDVNVRDVPLAPLARAHPNRIGVKSQLIMAWNRRPEFVELWLDRLVSACDHAYSFQFPQFRVRGSDRYRLFLGTHIRLALETEH